MAGLPRVPPPAADASPRARQTAVGRGGPRAPSLTKQTWPQHGAQHDCTGIVVRQLRLGSQALLYTNICPATCASA
eukprot:7432047-Lingulodinium_polyedra.AAC.1